MKNFLFVVLLKAGMLGSNIRPPQALSGLRVFLAALNKSKFTRKASSARKNMP